MDALNKETISALEHIISVAEDFHLNVNITQDIEKEELIIEDQNCERTTTMNCAMNSVGATIRQVCRHLAKRDLFSYKPNYVIGC